MQIQIKITREVSIKTTFPFLLRDTDPPYIENGQKRDRKDQGVTYPKNFNAVTAGGRSTPCPTVRTFIVRIVRNSQTAVSPSGVPSVVHVRSVIVPSEPPVAITPRCEYSRSWNAKEVMDGGILSCERSRTAIARPLMV